MVLIRPLESAVGKSASPVSKITHVVSRRTNKNNRHDYYNISEIVEPFKVQQSMQDKTQGGFAELEIFFGVK